MLHVTRCMFQARRVACCKFGMLHVTCCKLGVLYVTRCMLHVRHVACYTMQFVACIAIVYTVQVRRYRFQKPNEFYFSQRWLQFVSCNIFWNCAFCALCATCVSTPLLRDWVAEKIAPSNHVFIFGFRFTSKQLTCHVHVKRKPSLLHPSSWVTWNTVESINVLKKPSKTIPKLGNHGMLTAI